MESAALAITLFIRFSCIHSAHLFLEGVAVAAATSVYDAWGQVGASKHPQHAAALQRSTLTQTQILFCCATS
jgi:hypothetical protein